MNIGSLCPLISKLIDMIKRFVILSIASFVFLCLYLFVPFVFSLALFFFLVYQWAFLLFLAFRLNKDYFNIKETLDN